MAAEELPAIPISQSNSPQFTPAPHSLSLRLQQLLISCCKSIERDDFLQSQTSISELVDFLDSISDALVSDSCDEDSRNNAREVLSEIYRYISAPSLDQAVIDALSFELPKAVSKFSGVDHRCMEMADSVIQLFIERCSPRDMLSILCEALGSPTNTSKASSYFSPILKGLSKVFLFIQRRHFEQVKVAVPVIVNCLKAVSSELDDEDTDNGDLFNRAIGIASSIQAVCVKLEGNLNEKLRALLGLYLLQLMLSSFIPYCGLSYLGFITGTDVDILTRIICGDDEDGYMSCFSYIKHGAALAVVWGHISGEVAQVAGENLDLVIDELRRSQAKRCQTIGMLKHILSFVSLPWELKKHSVHFLINIMDGLPSQDDNSIDCSSYIPSLFGGLQALEMVIIYASDAVLRKNAFDAFKRVLADIPTSLRFDILKALITNCNYSSMIAVLLDCVKEGLRMDNLQVISVEKNKVFQEENKASQTLGFWNSGVLELVEWVLKPPKGGPPCLPEQSDAVLSALNLYRFVLIMESAGRTNRTGVLSKTNLQKAYNEWLLPLRTLVTGTMEETKKDHDQLAIDFVCALNPVELVLFRCIELTEEQLKRFA